MVKLPSRSDCWRQKRRWEDLRSALGMRRRKVPGAGWGLVAGDWGLGDTSFAVRTTAARRVWFPATMVRVMAGESLAARWMELSGRGLPSAVMLRRNQVRTLRAF